VILVFVHKVLSGAKSPVAGFGYDKDTGTLRIVIKSKTGLNAYDYLNVSPEDAGVFAQGFGKSLNYIKGKYECNPLGDIYSFE